MDKIIIARLKAFRKNLNYTQADVAELLGIDRTIYTKIENGAQPITVAQLVTVAGIYNTSVSRLVGQNEISLSTDELELIEIYRATPDHAKRSGIMLLRGWLEQNAATPQPSPLRRFMSFIKRIRFDISEVNRMAEMIEALPPDLLAQADAEIDEKFREEIAKMLRLGKGKEKKNPKNSNSLVFSEK